MESFQLCFYYEIKIDKVQKFPTSSYFSKIAEPNNKARRIDSYNEKLLEKARWNQYHKNKCAFVKICGIKNPFVKTCCETPEDKDFFYCEKHQGQRSKDSRKYLGYNFIQKSSQERSIESHYRSYKYSTLRRKFEQLFDDAVANEIMSRGDLPHQKRIKLSQNEQ